MPDPHAISDRIYEPKPLKFNRRAGVRKRVQGEALAAGYGRAGSITTRVVLIDASYSGIGVDSPIEFEVGTEIKLHFNGQVLAGRQGLVARCDPCDEGYRVGIDTASASAAA